MDVGVVMLKLVNLVGISTFPVEQSLDIGENHLFFIIFDVSHHLLLVFIVKMAQHRAIFLSTSLDDALQMLLDVWETLIQIVLV